MAERRVSVVVADDHPLFLEGTARALGEREDLSVVATAADGERALELIREHAPDVALLDVRMPGMDGLQVLSAVRGEGLGTRVLFLSASAEAAIAYAALAGGASGFLSKETDRASLAEAVAGVARGETRVDPTLQAGVFEQVRLRGASAERIELTPREAEILALVAEGLTAPAIADRLVVAVPTVKTHLAHLYEKLGVSDRAAAVAEAMRRGLLK